jgi:predicted XRE-type DNA-binding protein
MDKFKKKQLTAAGWKIGSVTEFPELNPDESALVEIKLALSRQLRDRREQRMTQAELARRIHSSQPRVANAEGGSNSVSLDLLVRAMLATGATPKDIGKVIASAGKTPKG